MVWELYKSGSYLPKQEIDVQEPALVCIMHDAVAGCGCDITAEHLSVGSTTKSKYTSNAIKMKTVQ